MFVCTFVCIYVLAVRKIKSLDICVCVCFFMVGLRHSLTDFSQDSESESVFVPQRQCS